MAYVFVIYLANNLWYYGYLYYFLTWNRKENKIKKSVPSKNITYLLQSHKRTQRLLVSFQFSIFLRRFVACIIYNFSYKKTLHLAEWQCKAINHNLREITKIRVKRDQNFSSVLKCDIQKVQTSLFCSPRGVSFFFLVINLSVHYDIAIGRS